MAAVRSKYIYVTSNLKMEVKICTKPGSVKGLIPTHHDESLCPINPPRLENFSVDSAMLLNLILLCIPFSFPSLYLAYRLARRGFLGSIFNQHVALMMLFTGGGQLER